MTPARLREIARPHRGAFLLLMALMLAESAVWLALPWIGGQMAGRVLAAAPASLGGVVALLLLGLAAAAVLRAGLAFVSGTIAARVLADLRTRIHDHLQVLPLSFHQAHTGGDLLALSTYEIARLGDLLTGTLAALPSQILAAAGAIVLMARIDPGLALAVPVLVPLFYLALKVTGRRLRGLGQAVQEAEAAVVASAHEDLAMVPATKSFTREEVASRAYAARVRTARDLGIREAAAYAVLGTGTNLVAGAAAVLLLALAARGLRDGTMSPAEMVSFLLYALLLTRPVAALAQVYGRVQSTRGTLARLDAILGADPEPGRDLPPRPGRAAGEIAFEDVRFAHPGRLPALRGLSLTIRAGETLALTGPNGAGKTTLASLLLRFGDPQSGSIRLDGADLRSLRLSDLRRQIGLVPQRPLLFDGSVRDNIGFGRDGASDTEIEAAARLAQAHGFIAGLPDGYATRIGENGVRLSGGQAQRLALARALLKDPPILILDEATSMYDLEGESAFVEVAATALKDRTVLIITHRPATLALADRIVTLDSGRIVSERRAA